MLTALLTPYGTFVFNYIPMGCSCSGDLFATCINKLFSDLIEQGQMTNIADNILCFDANNKSIILMLSNFLTDVLR